MATSVMDLAQKFACHLHAIAAADRSGNAPFPQQRQQRQQLRLLRCHIRHFSCISLRAFNTKKSILTTVTRKLVSTTTENLLHWFERTLCLLVRLKRCICHGALNLGGECPDAGSSPSAFQPHRIPPFSALPPTPFHRPSPRAFQPHRVPPFSVLFTRFHRPSPRAF